MILLGCEEGNGWREGGGRWGEGGEREGRGRGEGGEREGGGGGEGGEGGGGGREGGERRGMCCMYIFSGENIALAVICVVPDPIRRIGRPPSYYIAMEIVNQRCLKRPERSKVLKGKNIPECNVRSRMTCMYVCVCVNVCVCVFV